MLFFFFVPGKCVNIAHHITHTRMCHHETCKFCQLYCFEGFAGLDASTVHMWEGNWWLQQRARMVRTRVYFTEHSCLRVTWVCSVTSTPEHVTFRSS